MLLKNLSKLSIFIYSLGAQQSPVLPQAAQWRLILGTPAVWWKSAHSPHQPPVRLTQCPLFSPYPSQERSICPHLAQCPDSQPHHQNQLVRYQLFGLLVCWEFVWPCLGNDIDIKDNSTTVLTLDITLVRQIFMCTFTEIWSDFIFIFFKWISISYWFFFLPILIGFCVYKSVTYMQGQKWDDGCDYACTCYDAEHGRYKCDPK